MMFVWQKMRKNGWYPPLKWQNVRKGGETPLDSLMARPEEEWVVGRKLGTLRRSPLISQPHTPAPRYWSITNIHQNLDLAIFNLTWMLLGETPCLNRTTDGACVCMCVYETRWNIVGRQNNVEKMSGSVFKRYQVSRLELWRGGGRAAAALNTRSVSALLTALIHVAENPLLPPGYRKEQTCKATFGDVWHGQLTIYKSVLYESIKTTLSMGV